MSADKCPCGHSGNWHVAGQCVACHPTAMHHDPDKCATPRPAAPVTFKNGSQYPSESERVVVHRLGTTDGFLIHARHLSCRKVGVVGTATSYVPGHGGDVWFVRHDDGEVGAYCYDELRPAAPERPMVTGGGLIKFDRPAASDLGGVCPHGTIRHYACIKCDGNYRPAAPFRDVTTFPHDVPPGFAEALKKMPAAPTVAPGAPTVAGEERDRERAVVEAAKAIRDDLRDGTSVIRREHKAALFAAVDALRTGGERNETGG